MEKRFYIYKHTNKINNKVYIGQTCQKPEYRWGSQGQNYHSSHFKNAIQKYGWDNFAHEILYSNLSLEEANKIEELLIKQYNSTNPFYGYNSDKGGINKTPNNETRKLQSQSALNRPPMSIQTKEKLSKVNKGRKKTEETKQKMSISAKIRESNKKGKKSFKVKCVNTGEIFNSLRKAADWCGLVGVSGISSVCKNGKQKTAGIHPVTHEKLRWEYVDEDS